MAEKIALSGHIATTAPTGVFKACKPLFTNSPIDYFCYLRRYRNGEFTFLPTMIDLGSYLFEDGVYPDCWFAGLPFDQLKTGCFFYAIAGQVSSEQTNQIAKTIMDNFKFSAGIDMLDKHEDYCDFYSFASKDSGLYLLPITFFYQFIFYFKQQCQPLIRNAHEDRLYFPPEVSVLSAVPILETGMNNSNTASALFEMKRYYLSGKHEGVFLTKREVNIIRSLETGVAIKCVADELCISPRTLEHHVTNIKNKLNVSRTTELMYIARLNSACTESDFAPIFID